MVKVLESSGGHEDEEEDEDRAPEPECGSKLLIGSMIYQRVSKTSQVTQRESGGMHDMFSLQSALSGRLQLLAECLHTVAVARLISG